jgi:hypothetical protein
VAVSFKGASGGEGEHRKWLILLWLEQARIKIESASVELLESVRFYNFFALGLILGVFTAIGAISHHLLLSAIVYVQLEYTKVPHYIESSPESTMVTFFEVAPELDPTASTRLTTSSP